MTNRFPKHWDELAFLEAVSDVTAGSPKLQKQDYLTDGKYQVIDQGQATVGGYTDNPDLLAKVEAPTIIFGDHTRIFKYIEHPFCLGADGTKILEPKANLDRRFLFYYLSSLHIESAGYSRHFKFLKEKTVPVPPLEEQKRIAAILDKADTIRKKRQQAIQLADEFLRSVFLDMFGDPVTNDKDWHTVKFSDIGSLERGKSTHRPRNDPILLGGKYPLIQTGDVANSGGYITAYTSTYSEVGMQQSRIWPAGTLCITIAANIAKTGILTFDACFPDSVVGFTSNGKATVEYVQYWLSFLQKVLEANAPVVAQKNINLAILRDLDVPLPDIELQKKFSMTVNSMLKVKDKNSSFINEPLFNSLSQKAFSGKL